MPELRRLAAFMVPANAEYGVPVRMTNNLRGYRPFLGVTGTTSAVR